MTAKAHVRPVHLAGSVPLKDAEEVFRTASSILGERARRLPDGETGVRSNWIGWQSAVFARNSALELVPNSDKEYGLQQQYRLRPGVSPDAIEFDDLGYSSAALQSYTIFARLKAEGAILSGTRFQVCLPTPLAPVTAFVGLDSRATVEPAYESRMLVELERICAKIPHDELAIQWDTAIEFGVLEGVMPTHLKDPKREIIARLVDLGERVPSDVELGFHLCYGDAGHQHFVQPKNARLLVEVANGICAGVRRTVNWVHMPVPRDRDDAAYYAPLGELRLKPETELYLGLVHYSDGVEGTRRRMAAASQVVSEFGLATECGFGRRPPETVAPLLRLHREAAKA